MVTENNLHVPDELLRAAQRIAESQGRTADALAAEALKRYIAHETLNSLSREGKQIRARLALNTEEDVERYVQEMISEARRDRQP